MFHKHHGNLHPSPNNVTDRVLENVHFFLFSFLSFFLTAVYENGLKQFSSLERLLLAIEKIGDWKKLEILVKNQ